MKLTSLLPSVIISGLIVILCLFVYNHYFTAKTGYIEIKKVFDGFQMKKELESKYKQTETGRQKILDSLAFNLKLISKHLNEQKAAKATLDQQQVYSFEYQREEYLKMKNQFAEDNVALSQKYDAQILAQLTQYVIEYGKKNNYDIIFGADGNGNLMYAKDSYNLSEQMITYINNKYKGVE